MCRATPLSVTPYVPDQPAVRADAALRQALAACDRARECAVMWFAEIRRRQLYRELGHASLELYAVHELGFSRNRTWQFQRLADDLERLPRLREAVAAGELGWTKAQQVARIADPATEADWVCRAKTTGRRELTLAVTAARRREVLPAQGPDQLELRASGPAPVAVVPAQAPTSITLRADGPRLARFESLLERARRLGAVPRGVDRLDVVLAALEALVEGAAVAGAVVERAPNGDVAVPEPAGPARRRPASGGPATRIIIQQCPDCGRATAVAGRGEVPLAPAQLAAAACDARVRGLDGRNRASIPPATRAAVLARDRHRCATPGCGMTRCLEVHHVVPRARGGSNRAENLVTLCGRCHRFAHERPAGAGMIVAPAQGPPAVVPPPTGVALAATDA